MASPVPYTGTTEVAPNLPPAPRPFVDAPIAAFGGAVAQATEKLGQTSDQVGNELYARAVALEQLHQESLANTAATDTSTKMGLAQAKYLTLEGNNAVDGLTDHIKAIDDIRVQGRNSLDSPYAQSLYDRDSRYMQSWTIRSAADHAAQQGKAFYDGSLKAKNEQVDNIALSNPLDPQALQSAITEKQATVHQQAISGGWSPDREKFESQTEVSKLVSNNIMAVGKTKPFEAKRILDDASKSGQISGQDSARVQAFIERQQYTVGARVEAGKLLAGGDLRFGDHIVEMPRAMDAIGNKESSGNYNTDVMSFDRSGHEQHALGKYGIMDFNLQPWLKEAGMEPMTAAEFKANRQAQDALFKFKFGQLQTKYGNFNGAASEWLGGPGWNTTATDKFGTNVPMYLRDTNATLARSASEGELTSAAQAKGKELAPDDPLVGDYIGHQVQSLHEQDIKVQKDNEFNNRQTVYEGLVQGDRNGKLPTTVDELKALSPEVATAWDNMQAPHQIQVMEILNKNAKGDVAWNPQRQARYQELTGMAVHQPDQFLDQDILKEDLPWAAKREFIKLQSQVYKKAEADPQVTKALGVLRSKLNAAGYTRIQDQDGLNQFTGALRGALQAYQDTYKKPPSDEDVNMIGTRLLQKQGAAWYTSGTEQFKMPVPDEAAKTIRDDPQWAEWGVEPTDQDVERIYTRALFQDLYAKQKAHPK